MSQQIDINVFPEIFPSIIDNDRLCEVYKSLSSYFSSGEVESYPELIRLMEGAAESDIEEYILTMKAASKAIDIRNILPLGKMKELSLLLGIKSPVQFSNPVLHISGERLCRPGNNFDVPVHQDWPSTLGSLNAIIIWISLGGTSKDYGGLNFYKFNDTPKILDCKDSGCVMEILPEELQKLDLEYVSISPGDAIIFGHMLPHGSTSSEHSRLAVSVRIDDASDPYWKKRKYDYAQKVHIKRAKFSEKERMLINDYIKKN